MLSSPTEPHLRFSYEKAGYLYQNCVTFDSNDFGCSITLVNNDSSLCIEVYVDMSNLDDQELSELCPAVRTKVLKGIREASSKNHYEIDFNNVFFAAQNAQEKNCMSHM